MAPITDQVDTSVLAPPRQDFDSLRASVGGVRLAKSTFWPWVDTLPILVPAVVSVSDMAVPAGATRGEPK